MCFLCLFICFIVCFQGVRCLLFLCCVWLRFFVCFRKGFDLFFNGNGAYMIVYSSCVFSFCVAGGGVG